MERLTARSDILEKINQVCVKENIKNYKIVNVETNAKGEGFLGEIYFVSIKDNDTVKTLDLVIKAAFTSELVRKNAPIQSCFQNEIYFYTKIIPAFQDFIKLNGLDESTLSMIPKCHDISSKDGAELIVLENLKPSGFQVLDKQVCIDEDHVELVFKTYGIYHGCSLAYKEKCPESYHSFCKNLNNVYDELLKNDPFMESMIKSAKTVDDYFIPKKDDELKQIYQKCIDSTYEKFRQSIATNCDSSVIIHGDCWSNNMMYAYQSMEKGNIPADVRFLDFQLTKSGSPICDLSYFFYSGVSVELYDKLDDYLEIYYKSLINTIQQLGGNSATITLHKLKEEWKKFATLGFFMSIVIFKVKATRPEDIHDFTDGIDVERDMNFDRDVFGPRIANLFRHIHQYRVI